MKKKNENRLTEIVFVLDRSGSMSRLVDDTIGGFNSVLAREQKKEGEAYITTMLFDHDFEILHDHLDIRKVKPITQNEYYPGGCTALYDAVGMTINKMDGIVRNEEGCQVLMVIITDGLENSSHEFEGRQIREMVNKRQDQGWEFLFLGANIDSFAVGEGLGFRKDRTSNWKADKAGAAMSYAVLGEVIGNYRQHGMIKEDALNELNEDSKR